MKNSKTSFERCTLCTNKYCRLAVKTGSALFLLFFLVAAQAAPLLTQLGSALFIFFVLLFSRQAPMQEPMPPLPEPPGQALVQQFDAQDIKKYSDALRPCNFTQQTSSKKSVVNHHSSSLALLNPQWPELLAAAPPGTVPVRQKISTIFYKTHYQVRAGPCA